MKELEQKSKINIQLFAEPEKPTESIETEKTDNIDSTEVKPYKAFATQKEYDDFCAFVRKNGEKRVKDPKEDKDIEAFFRNKFETEAKMTESEKLNAEREEWNKKVREDKIELNRSKAKVLLSKYDFQEDEMDIYLDSIDDNEETSIGRIQRICDNRKSVLDKERKKIEDTLNAQFGSINYKNEKKDEVLFANKFLKKDDNKTDNIKNFYK